MKFIHSFGRRLDLNWRGKSTALPECQPHESWATFIQISSWLMSEQMARMLKYKDYNESFHAGSRNDSRSTNLLLGKHSRAVRLHVKEWQVGLEIALTSRSATPCVKGTVLFVVLEVVLISVQF